MSVFDSKNFNAEVFQRYVDTIPNTKRNELITVPIEDAPIEHNVARLCQAMGI